MPASADALRPAIRTFVAQLDEASTRRAARITHFAVAGGRVAVHTSGHPAVDSLLTALAPLRAPAGAADLEVHLWDAAHDADAVSQSPILGPAALPHAGVGGYSDAGLNAFFQPETGALSVLNVGHRRAHWWLRDASSVQYFERASPFKYILQWWVASRGGAMLHSAAIAAADRRDPRGVLITGPSGSGKSSSTLACVERGMGFASDDYVIIGGEQPPLVHLAYSTAKVVRGSLDRFPRYHAHFRNLARDDEKPMMFMHEAAPDLVRTSFTPIALVLPRVVHAAHTSFVPISPAVMLRALAPSSVMYFPLAGARALARMSTLCKQLPCLRADLASDPQEVAAAFARLLEPSGVCAANAA